MFLGQSVPPEAIPVVCLASNGVFLLIECHLNVHLAALFVICLHLTAGPVPYYGPKLDGYY